MPELPDYLAGLAPVLIDGAAGVALIDPPVAPQRGDTNPTFVHWCTRPHNADDEAETHPRWVLSGTPLHTVVTRTPWHLEASLLCPDCGLHGWIRDGSWTSA